MAQEGCGGSPRRHERTFPDAEYTQKRGLQLLQTAQRHQHKKCSLAGWLPSSNCDYSYISTCNSTPCCRHRRTGELLSPPLGSSLVPAARHATLLLPSPAPAFHYNQGSTVVFGRPATRRLLNLDQNGMHGPHRAVLNPCMVVWPHYEYIHTARRAAPPSFSHHSLLRLGCAEVQPHSQLCRPAPSPTP